MVNLIALMATVSWIQDPTPATDVSDPNPRLYMRLLWAHPVIRTDSREYDAGIFSGALNLHDDADVPDRSPIVGLELEWLQWRLSLFAIHLEGEKTLAEPLIFEEQEFEAGTRLQAEFEGGWIDAVHRANVGLDDGNGSELKLLLGLTWAKYRFAFRGGDKSANEGHPALWPVPAVGMDGRLRLLDSLDIKARVLATRLAYMNPFHQDGGATPKVIFDSVRAEIGIEWKTAETWALGLGIHRISSYLRDTSDEDRHRVWFDATSIFFDVSVSF